MYLREYETTVIMKSDLAPAVMDGAIEKWRDLINDNGGKLLEINHWGKKKLAYEIKKQSRGVYFHTCFLGEGPTVDEFERNLKLSENILRFMTIQLGDKVNPEDRIVKEFVKPQYEIEEPSKDENEDNAKSTDEKEYRAARDSSDEEGASSQQVETDDQEEVEQETEDQE